MKNIKFILPFLSYCLFFMAQAVNAQYYGYEDDLQIIVYCKGISDPSHISTLDFCDIELINKNGLSYYCPVVLMGEWSGDFHVMQEVPFVKNKFKGHFLKAGTCKISVGGISKTVEISDPYLTNTSTLLFYGQEETVEVLNLPKEDVSITWLVSDGLKIVSGQGTSKVVYTTKENTSSYEYIQANVQSQVWILALRNNVSISNIPQTNEFQLSRTSSNSFMLNVDQETTLSAPVKYELYDQARGSLMRKGMVESKAGVLNFENLSKGIYVLKLYLDEKNIQTRKILIN